MERKLNVVSVCFEAMLAQKFHIYAGGLGVVQAGLLKSAGRGDWQVNLYGLGILWKQGYYDQEIDLYDPEKHYMKIKHVTRHYDFLEDTGVKVQVIINGYPNTIKVWYLPPKVFKTAPCFFLDTDLEENDELAKSITRCLYGGTEETRLAQEIVLGIGGVRAFEALGKPIDLWHGQEGHTLLIAIELLRKNLEAGMNFAEALEATRQKYVFTTHTPEIAGNEKHKIDLMIRMGCFPDIPKEMALGIGGDPFDNDDEGCPKFNMTVGALKLARRVNAVSKLHLRTTQQMWAWIKEEEKSPIISITNGVDGDWQFPEFARANSVQELQMVKEKYKERLIKYNEKRTGKVFKKEIPIIVWARRFTPYKRPELIFADWPWLRELLLGGKMQLIFAGKPHPYDRFSITYFNWVYEKSLEVTNLSVWAGYEYHQSKILKAGADIWLQTPRRPREACATSWISAILNGALVVSSRDGGILEIPEECYFPFGVGSPCISEGEQDSKDYKDLIKVLIKAIEMYPNRAAWFQKVLSAMQFIKKNFTSDRMLEEYINDLYLSD